MKPAVTLTIRRRSSGYKVAALAVDSLDHAWALANIIVRSPEYARCFVVGVGWDGAEVFSVGFTAQPPVAPAYPPALPSPSYAPQYPVGDAYAAHVVEAQPVTYGPAAPLLPPRRW